MAAGRGTHCHLIWKELELTGVVSLFDTAQQREPAAAPDQDEIRRFVTDVESVASNISRVVVSSEERVQLALIGLFGQGHVLLEDLPGVGKTLLGKSIARSIDCDFKRVQFTPDLLPSDITGTTVYDMQSSQFRFVPGPIFANVVLADELNRAGPRTQSALLEAMAEFQVSVEGDVRKLPQPFLVIATQNMLESHGTFPLPDSQKDRFLVSMGMGMPTAEQEAEILLRSQHGMPEAQSIITGERVMEMQALVRRIEVSLPVRQYIVNLCRASRSHPDVSHGVSPRGGAALQRAAQCHAAFNGRSFATPDDVAIVAPHVMAHRLMMKPGFEESASEAVTEFAEATRVPA